MLSAAVSLITSQDPTGQPRVGYLWTGADLVWQQFPEQGFVRRGHRMNDSGNTGGSYMPPDWPSRGLEGRHLLFLSWPVRLGGWHQEMGRSPWKGQLTMAPSPSQNMGDYDPLGDLDWGRLGDHCGGKAGQSRSECKRARAWVREPNCPSSKPFPATSQLCDHELGRHSTSLCFYSVKWE